MNSALRPASTDTRTILPPRNDERPPAPRQISPDHSVPDRSRLVARADVEDWIAMATRLLGEPRFVSGLGAGSAARTWVGVCLDRCSAVEAAASRDSRATRRARAIVRHRAAARS